MLPPLVRDRLTRRLDESRSAPVVVVSGIAGAGKSTAVRHWLAADGRPHVIVELDERDDDSARFWERTRTALGVGDVPGEAERDVIDELIGALSDSVRRILVLDDLHVVTDSGIRESLAYFAERMPSDMQLVVASRAPLPPSFARMMSAGRVRMIGGEELAFTPTEVAALLGRAVDDAAVRRVVETTRGWAIAVALSRGVLDGDKDTSPAEERQRLDGALAWRDAADFLVREVLRTLPESVQDFALNITVLDELTPAVADAALGRDDAARSFAQLAERGVLVARSGGQWAMHAVVRDALRTELDRRSPERARTISARASRYFTDRDIPRAIAYALAADDAVRAAELIELHRAELQEVRYAVQLRWLRALPDQLVRERPALCAHAVTVASYERRPDLVARWLHDHDSRSARTIEDLGALTVHCIRVGDLPRLADVAGRLHAGVEEGHPLWRLSCGALTGALVAMGDREGALAVITGMLRPVGQQPVQFLGLQSSGRAVATILLGELGHREQARASLAMLREWVADASAIEGYTDLGAVDWAASALATQDGDRAVAAAWRSAPTPQAAFGLGFLEAWLAIDFAAARLADDDEDAARRWLLHARSLLARSVDPAQFGDRLRAVGGPLGILPLAHRGRPRARSIELSDRELGVLQLLDSELSSREIAARLFVSPNTLKSHLRAVYRKLGVNSRHSALRVAHELGLIHPVG